MFSMFFLLVVVSAKLLRGGAGDDQCSPYEVTPGRDSPVMDSLQCFNDYKTHVRCTWETDPQDNVSSIQLYYRDTKKETLCVLEEPNVILANGKSSHACRYNTKRFTLNTNHALLFKVPCGPTTTTFRIAQKGKVRAPVDLTEKSVDGGDHLLSWESPYPVSTNITSSLVYQLQYRRHMGDWTTVDNISKLQLIIEKEALMPGYQYQARVRSRGYVGLYSDWSPLVSWKTDYDENRAFDLECVIEGDTAVECTWKIKKEHAHFMAYHIWCQDRDNTTPYVCCETPRLLSTIEEFSEFACSVNTTDPNSLTVEFRPVQFSRTFSTSKHIRLPKPDPVQVLEEEEVFKLSWSKPSITKHFEYMTELKTTSKEDSRIYNLSMGIEDFEISPQILLYSTDYRAQIRFWLLPKASHMFQPSEWSEPTVFTTKPALSSINYIFYILVGVLGPMVILILYSILPVCHRRVVLWKGTIPSPIQSKVLDGMTKKYPSRWPFLQNEKELTSVCVLLTANAIEISNRNVPKEPSVVHTEDPVKTEHSVESNLLSTFIEEQKCKEKVGLRFTGPYIFSHEHFRPQNEASELSTEAQNSTSVEHLNTGLSDEPPEYTPNPDPICPVIANASGYIMMPCVPSGQCQPTGYLMLSHNEPNECP